jgi:hypothetical protein
MFPLFDSRRGQWPGPTGNVPSQSTRDGGLLRTVARAVPILIGLAAIGETFRYIVAAIGEVPLLTGMLDICLFAPLLAMPLRAP